jgi:hypothetical protein
MPLFVMRWSVCSYSVVSIEVGGCCVFNLSRSGSLKIGNLMTETWLFIVYGYGDIVHRFVLLHHQR